MTRAGVPDGSARDLRYCYRVEICYRLDTEQVRLAEGFSQLLKSAYQTPSSNL